MRQQISRASMGIGAILILGGCSTFQLTEEPFTPKGKTFAVVAGLTNPGSLQATLAFTSELEKTSQFRVMPQKQVSQVIPNYPQLVKGPYNSAYFEIDIDYGKTDIARVKELQKHVGTDYLYILWAPSITSNGQRSFFSKNYSIMQVVAQLFEFPSGKEVGHGKYMVRIDDEKKDILREDVQRVAQELAEKTHTLK